MPKKKSYSVREVKGGGKKRGRKPLNLGAAERIEQSRQSARECRARKKLRYQYVEELVTSHEKAISSLRLELEMLKQCCIASDRGLLAPEYQTHIASVRQKVGDADIANHMVPIAQSDGAVAEAGSTSSVVETTDEISGIPDFLRLLSPS